MRSGGLCCGWDRAVTSCSESSAGARRTCLGPWGLGCASLPAAEAEGRGGVCPGWRRPLLYQTQTVARGPRPPGQGLPPANSGTSYPALTTCPSRAPQPLRRRHLRVSAAPP